MVDLGRSYIDLYGFCFPRQCGQILIIQSPQ